MNTLPSDNPFVTDRLNSDHDYRPEWDVLGLNRKATDTLVARIRETAGKPVPDPAQKIQIILAPPGYGKTHLFGRVAHELAAETFFVFVPAFEDSGKALSHIRRHVVDALFRTVAGRPSMIRRAMARLCQSSFLGYLGGFNAVQAARFSSLTTKIQDDPAAVLDVVGRVSTADPFLRLAKSVVDRFPDHASQLIQILAMGWSPLGRSAQRWLRGEDLPEEDLAALGLDPDAESSEPPTALQVLRAIPALLQHTIPVVICCDQLEMVLKDKSGPEQVSAQVMEILAQVPTTVLVLSCLRDEWKSFHQRMFAALKQRCAPELKLDDLNDAAASDLVVARLRGTQHARADLGPTWPIVKESVSAFLRKNVPAPRLLLKACAEAFDKWLNSDRSQGVYVGEGPEVPLSVQFQRMWATELDAVADDPEFSWDSYPEDRMHAAILDAMTIARDAGREMNGVRIRNVAEGPVGKPGNKTTGKGIAVDVEGATGSTRVLLHASILNNSGKFQYLINSIDHSVPNIFPHLLLVHRQAEFAMGATSKKKYEDKLRSKTLRLFALDQQDQAHRRLECLRRLGDGGEKAMLGGRMLSRDEARALIIETGVLDNLELFKELQAFLPAPVAKPIPVVKKAPVLVTAGGPPEKVSTPPPVAPTRPTEREDAARVVADLVARQTAWAREKLDALCGKLKMWALPCAPQGVEVGPTFARLKVEPTGSKVTFNKVRSTAADMRIHLGLKTTPLVESQAGYISVDVELPERRTVTLTEALAQPHSVKADAPAFPLGVDVAGVAHWLDLADTASCHLLVAGTTGSGKSELLRALVAGLAARIDPTALQFVLIDPKRVTFNLGSGESPYFPFPVAYDAEAAVERLNWCVEKMQERYDLLQSQKKSNVGELDDQTVLPRIVVVVDEFADLMTDKSTKNLLTDVLKRIGAMARAAGIHLVLATQRPDKDVVTPLLKANLPGKIALKVANEANSKLIIGEPSAAYLLGKGDLLWDRNGLTRLQGLFVPQPELESVLRAH